MEYSSSRGTERLSPCLNAPRVFQSQLPLTDTVSKAKALVAGLTAIQELAARVTTEARSTHALMASKGSRSASRGSRAVRRATRCGAVREFSMPPSWPMWRTDMSCLLHLGDGLTTQADVRWSIY